MANAMQGIMALPGAGMMDQGPRPADMPTQRGIDPSLIDPRVTEYARSNPQAFSQDMVDSMAEADPEMVLEMRMMLARYQLPEDVIDALSLMVDTLLDDPANYEANRAEFIKEGVPEEILPPNFDPAFLAGLGVALNQMSSMKPQKFARGGIVELKPIAKAMAAMGRNGDTMLAHITPSEARLLRVMGGSGTTNPYTGLPEFFLDKAFKAVGKVVSGAAKAVTGAVTGVAKAVGSVVKGAVNIVKEVAKPVVNVVKKIASNPIGKIALTAAAVYFMGPAGLKIAGTAGSITGLTGATAVGVNTFLGSTAVNLLSGQNLKESLKGGAIAGLTAGTISSVTGALPSGYDKVAPIRPDVSQIPAPAVGDYASSADAAMLQEAAAREAAVAAEAAAAAAPTTVSPIEAAVPGVSAPTVSAPTTSIPGLGDVIQAPTVAPPTVEPIQMAAAVPPGTMTDAAPAAAGSMGAAPANQTFLESIGVENVEPFTNAPSNVAIERQIGMTGPLDTVRQVTQGPVDYLKNIYNEYLSPSRGMPTAADIEAKARELAGPGAPITKSVVDAATTILNTGAPGTIARYAPLALAGTGALLASGAFTPKQPEPPGIVPASVRTGQPAEDIGIGGVNTVTAPGAPAGFGYGATNFYNVASGYSPTGPTAGAPQFQVRNPFEYLPSNLFGIQTYAQGGIASLGYKAGGKVRTYPRKTGAINGPGTETSDSIPALLSDGEFVFTAKAVRGAGGGSRRAGAKRMYALMKALENKANG